MGLEFLARVRRTTLWLALIGGLVVATYDEPMRALALALGTLWSIINLSLIEQVVIAITGADRKTFNGYKRAALALGGMLPLFAAGAFMLTRLAPVWLLGGFLMPFTVMIVKAITLLVLNSSFWKHMVASRWRAVAALSVMVLGLWWAADAWTGSNAPSAGAVAVAQEHDTGHGDETEPQDGHGADAGHGEDAHGEAASDAHGGDDAHGGGHAKEAGPSKFANVITILYRLFPNAEWAHFLHTFEAVIYSLLVAFLISLVAYFATRNAKLIPGPLQNVVEKLVEYLYDFIVGILGPKYGPRYVPFLGSLFVYILAMNLFGLIPLMDSPTSSLNVTVGLALCVFFYSQFIGFKELGVVGYIDHMMGSPRTMISWLLVPLMLPIHLLGEIAKPISLSARLFGNVFGEDMLLVAFASLGVTVLAFTGMPIGLPLQLPFLFLALLTSTIQALVFTVLSTIYFLLMLPHDDHGHEHEEAVQPAH